MSRASARLVIGSLGLAALCAVLAPNSEPRREPPGRPTAGGGGLPWCAPTLPVPAPGPADGPVRLRLSGSTDYGEVFWDDDRTVGAYGPMPDEKTYQADVWDADGGRYLGRRRTPVPQP